MAATTKVTRCVLNPCIHAGPIPCIGAGSCTTYEEANLASSIEEVFVMPKVQLVSQGYYEVQLAESSAALAECIVAPNVLGTQRFAMDFVAAAAGRLPKTKTEYKALMRLAVAAKVAAEVKAMSSGTLSASDADEDVFDLVVEWGKAVKVYLAREPQLRGVTSDDKVAVLWDCYGSVL